MSSEYRQPGMYMHLYHGFESEEARQTANAEAEAGLRPNYWGSVGPDFGPLTAVHETYAATIQVHFDPDKFDAQKFFEGQTDIDFFGRDSFWLNYEDDCVLLNGIRYGDWAVYYVG